MTDFQQYRRKQIAELRPWQAGDDMSRISISAPDKEAGSPKSGDMIARNPKNHDDQWLVAAAYFADNFEPKTAKFSQAALLLAAKKLRRLRIEDIFEVAIDRFWDAPGGNDLGVKAVVEFCRGVFLDKADDAMREQALRITDLRIALNDIIALDHQGPESRATEIARAALRRDDDIRESVSQADIREGVCTASEEREAVLSWLDQNAKFYADMVVAATDGMKAPARAQAALCVQLQRDIRAGAHLAKATAA